MRLPVSIDKANGVPVYLQMGQQIRLLTQEGKLKAGDPMPTVREMAVALRINANTVTRVYHRLQDEGVLKLHRGVGTFVADSVGRPIPPRDLKTLAQKVEQLVVLGRKAGMGPAELSQLIETHWKESHDDAG